MFVIQLLNFSCLRFSKDVALYYGLLSHLERLLEVDDFLITIKIENL